MIILKHQNVYGTLEYNNKDNLYCGKILSDKGYFLYHGKTEEDAIEDFKIRVLDYLEYCKENNIEKMKIVTV